MQRIKIVVIDSEEGDITKINAKTHISWPEEGGNMEDIAREVNRLISLKFGDEPWDMLSIKQTGPSLLIVTDNNGTEAVVVVTPIFGDVGSKYDVPITHGGTKGGFYWIKVGSGSDSIRVVDVSKAFAVEKILKEMAKYGRGSSKDVVAIKQAVLRG